MPARHRENPPPGTDRPSEEGPTVPGDAAMSTCREAVEELWAYIDGELPAGERDRVHRHLQACRDCFPHYDFQKAFLDFMRRQSERPVPVGLRRRVFLRLLAEESHG